MQIDDQLELIADDLRNGGRVPLSTPARISAGPESTSSGAVSVTSHRSNGGDDRRRRRDDGGKTKPAKSGRGTDPEITAVDGNNWQLKSSADSGPVMHVMHRVKPVNNGSVSSRNSKHNSTRNPVIPAEQMNFRAVNNSDERARIGRGQTSTEVKQHRSTQRQNSNGPITNHYDWLTPTPEIRTKPEFVAVDSPTNVKFKNNRIRCVVM